MTKQLLYSKLPFAQIPAVAHGASHLKRFYEAARAGGLSFLPHLGWMTLYKIDPSRAAADPK